ncbi:hypothetical protein EKO04_010530 [Ascochyta lentis]|uniref:Lysosomal dipeptide transporter MFSD1 n=1 Tax=Ascochyta lentis TaxID=205686 RepID=A0A8H7ITE0_9PLEO|nr:hypothetical protein EKO04_010530 [Ascochyta lentis]
MASDPSTQIQAKQLDVSIIPITPLPFKGCKVEVDHQPTDLDKPFEHVRLDFNSAAHIIPWKYKILALVCVVSLPIGQTWTGASLGPLKNTLRQELGISNTQFGVISASDAIVNSIWPIIGGMLLDWFGPNIIVICCTGVILVGSTLAGLAINLEMWRLLAGGHILMGFGIAVLDSATQKFFYHWFGAGGLALAFGLESAVARTIDLVAGMAAIPIRDSTGWYGWTFWISAVFCAFSFLVAIAYLLFERFVVPSNFSLRSARKEAQETDIQTKKLSFASITTLPWAFWMLPMTQLLQSGAAGGFNTSSADIIRMRGFTEAVAGYLSSAQSILPIVLSPVLGLFIDRYGHRFHFVALAPVFWIISCALLGWSSVHLLVALVFSSLAGVINSMPLQVCIPLLVADQSKLGTAFGIWRAFNNSGSTIVDIVFGVLQDSTKDNAYPRVLLFAIGVKVLAFLLGLTYIFVDYKALRKSITLTRRQREDCESKISDPKFHPLTRREMVMSVSYAGLGLLGSIIISAWVVFIRYLL